MYQEKPLFEDNKTLSIKRINGIERIKDNKLEPYNIFIPSYEISYPEEKKIKFRYFYKCPENCEMIFDKNNTLFYCPKYIIQNFSKQTIINFLNNINLKSNTKNTKNIKIIDDDFHFKSEHFYKQFYETYDILRPYNPKPITKTSKDLDVSFPILDTKINSPPKPKISHQSLLFDDEIDDDFKNTQKMTNPSSNKKKRRKNKKKSSDLPDLPVIINFPSNSIPLKDNTDKSISSFNRYSSSFSPISSPIPSPELTPIIPTPKPHHITIIRPKKPINSSTSIEKIIDNVISKMNDDIVIKDKVNSDIVIKDKVNSDIVIEDKVNDDIFIKDKVNSDIFIEDKINSDIVIKDKVNSDIVIEDKVNSDIVIEDKVDEFIVKDKIEEFVVKEKKEEKREIKDKDINREKIIYDLEIEPIEGIDRGITGLKEPNILELMNIIDNDKKIKEEIEFLRIIKFHSIKYYEQYLNFMLYSTVSYILKDMTYEEIDEKVNQIQITKEMFLNYMFDKDDAFVIPPNIHELALFI